MRKKDRKLLKILSEFKTNSQIYLQCQLYQYKWSKIILVLVCWLKMLQDRPRISPIQLDHICSFVSRSIDGHGDE